MEATEGPVETKRCPLCEKDIELAKFRMHDIGCSRANYKCKECNMCVPKAEREEHEEEEHDGYEHDVEDFYEDRENEHGEIETTLGRLEVIRQLAEIAENETATAAYALMQMEEIVDDEEEAIEVLNHLLDTDPAKPIKNLIRMKLAELHIWSDQTEEATEVLAELIKD